MQGSMSNILAATPWLLATKTPSFANRFSVKHQTPVSSWRNKHAQNTIPKTLLDQPIHRTPSFHRRRAFTPQSTSEGLEYPPTLSGFQMSELCPPGLRPVSYLAFLNHFFMLRIGDQPLFSLPLNGTSTTPPHEGALQLTPASLEPPTRRWFAPEIQDRTLLVQSSSAPSRNPLLSLTLIWSDTFFNATRPVHFAGSAITHSAGKNPQRAHKPSSYRNTNEDGRALLTFWMLHFYTETTRSGIDKRIRYPR